MSYIRNVATDRAATQIQLENAQAAVPRAYTGDGDDGRNWLGHTKGARMLDIQLLRESTMAQLTAVSGRTELSVLSHIQHLRDEHGLDVLASGGRYQLRSMGSSRLDDCMNKMILAGAHEF
jgi:biotin operon repressor